MTYESLTHSTTNAALVCHTHLEPIFGKNGPVFYAISDSRAGIYRYFELFFFWETFLTSKQNKNSGLRKSSISQS